MNDNYEKFFELEAALENAKNITLLPKKLEKQRQETIAFINEQIVFIQNKIENPNRKGREMKMEELRSLNFSQKEAETIINISRRTRPVIDMQIYLKEILPMKIKEPVYFSTGLITNFSFNPGAKIRSAV